MKIGSEAHKELFCNTFIESHWVYEPAELAWPKLDDVHLQRLRSIPFWGEALKTELEAGSTVAAFAAEQGDPLLRQAIQLQAEEESRHARLIRFMVEHYGVEMGKPQAEPFNGSAEKAFIYFGYGECLDSFGAFGLFELARQAAFLPEPFFLIFDRVLDEEARHIVFFINWMAYRQVSKGRGAKVLRAASSAWYYSKALKHLIGVIRDADNENESFTATGGVTFIDDLTARQFLSVCLNENARRMVRLNSQLLQPRLLPRMAKVALAGLKFLPQRKSKR